MEATIKTSYLCTIAREKGAVWDLVLLCVFAALEIGRNNNILLVHKP